MVVSRADYEALLNRTDDEAGDAALLYDAPKPSWPLARCLAKVISPILKADIVREPPRPLRRSRRRWKRRWGGSPKLYSLAARLRPMPLRLLLRGTPPRH